MKNYILWGMVDWGVVFVPEIDFEKLAAMRQYRHTLCLILLSSNYMKIEFRSLN